jgi:glutathione S-transferase
MLKLPGLAGSRTGAQRVMHYADNTLAKRAYFAGNQFTAADIMMHFALKLGAPIAAGAEMNVKEILSGEKPYLDAFPNVKDFMQRTAARAAQRAMKRRCRTDRRQCRVIRYSAHNPPSIV